LKPRTFAAAAFCLAAVVLAALPPVRSCGPRKGAEGSCGPIEAAAAEAVDAAVAAETKAVEARSRAKVARQRAKAAAKGREAAPMPLECLPVAVQVEIEALADLVVELEAQVVLEAARGDAWKEAALAEQEAAAAVQAETKGRGRAAWRRGVKVGAAGAAAVVLILVLL